MTTEAQQVLASFGQLSAEEQLFVGREIQKRVKKIRDPFADVDFSPMDEEERTFLAARLFAMYDEEEARRDGDS